MAVLKEMYFQQLDGKFKYVVDFGVVTTKKNIQTINQFEEAIKSHITTPDTI